MTHEPSKLHATCPMERTMAVIGGKWKLLILWHLHEKRHRFSELQRALPTITTKMLTQQLRELEADSVITRTVFAVIPPRVEYELSPLGKELITVMHSLHTWGELHQAKTQIEEK